MSAAARRGGSGAQGYTRSRCCGAAHLAMFVAPLHNAEDPTAPAAETQAARAGARVIVLERGEPVERRGESSAPSSYHRRRRVSRGQSCVSVSRRARFVSCRHLLILLLPHGARRVITPSCGRLRRARHATRIDPRVFAFRSGSSSARLVSSRSDPVGRGYMYVRPRYRRARAPPPAEQRVELCVRRGRRGHLVRRQAHDAHRS